MGEALVVATIWVALACYPAGPWGRVFRSGDRTDRSRPLRLIWTLGCAAFLAHVAASFHVFYDWSHGVALSETARQVEELFGVRSGSGLYLNYLFTLVWLVDAIAWWRWPGWPGNRARWALLAIHGFFLFMIFNATVVFEQGATRLFGAAVTVAGLWGLVAAVRSRSAS
ncbi:hypothetical protein ABI59_17255 [Acidobacteria bacterium Mor1]|nr:hypothetical protein ABI59_17255 [Acidobacteria bacterium Mor1]